MALPTSTFHKIPESTLHTSRPTSWLTSRFHFSFAGHYYDEPAKNLFGVLRVLNDDIVTAREGFGRHPHRDMEIVSLPIAGQLTHQDSTGNKESLGRGTVQYMSAGTGIRHSEMNEGDVDCRFLQIWITPDRAGHTPNYGSRNFDATVRFNKLGHVVAGRAGVDQLNDSGDGPIPIHQDANIFISEFEQDVDLTYHLGSDRMAYLVDVEGDVRLENGSNGVDLAMRDASHVFGPMDLVIKSRTPTAYVAMIEMAKTDPNKPDGGLW